MPAEVAAKSVQNATWFEYRPSRKRPVGSRTPGDLGREDGGSDNLLVHPQWLTVHEVYHDGTARCGNGSSGGIHYLSMTRSQARAMGGSKPCASLACIAARRGNSPCPLAGECCGKRSRHINLPHLPARTAARGDQTPKGGRTSMGWRCGWDASRSRQTSPSQQQRRRRLNRVSLSRWPALVPRSLISPLDLLFVADWW